MVEVELLAAGLLSRERDGDGRERLRLTDAGVRLLAETLQANRAARNAHEALVDRVAREMQRAGRIVWRGLALRAPVAAAAADPSAPAGDAAGWAIAMPDVYSVRHTTLEDYLTPRAHEIKVSRADLLSDLRRPAKGEAYRWLAGECWYVIREGIARLDEIPAVYGVMVAPDRGPLEVARTAPQRPMKLPFAVWMALARARPEPPLDDDAQSAL